MLITVTETVPGKNLELMGMVWETLEEELPVPQMMHDTREACMKELVGRALQRLEARAKEMGADAVASVQVSSAGTGSDAVMVTVYGMAAQFAQ